MNLVLVALVAVLVGFVAGALLSASLTSEAKAVESRVRLALLVARNDIERKRAQLEQDAISSFKEVEKDIVEIKQHLEIIDHNQAVKVANALAPDAPRA